jgi:predicted small lipoprotein YifL
MKAPTACRQPHLVQGLLQIDHDLAAVREGQSDHAAHPLVIDVRVGVVVQAIAADLNASKKAFSVVQKFKVGHYNRWMLKVFKILVMVHALVGGAAMLSACGIKGALYLPNTPESQDRATLPQTLKPWPDTPAPTPPAKK